MIIRLVNAPEIDQRRHAGGILHAELADHAGHRHDLAIQLVHVEQARQRLPLDEGIGVIGPLRAGTVRLALGENAQALVRFGFDAER